MVYDSEWYRANRERVKEYQRRYRERKLMLQAQGGTSRGTEPLKVPKKMAKGDENDPIDLADDEDQEDSESQARKSAYERNKARVKEWRLKNPDKMLAYRQKALERRKGKAPSTVDSIKESQIAATLLPTPPSDLGILTEPILASASIEFATVDEALDLIVIRKNCPRCLGGDLAMAVRPALNDTSSSTKLKKHIEVTVLRHKPAMPKACSKEFSATVKIVDEKMI